MLLPPGRPRDGSITSEEVTASEVAADVQRAVRRGADVVANELAVTPRSTVVSGDDIFLLPLNGRSGLRFVPAVDPPPE